MTDREMLELLLEGQKDIKANLNKLENKVTDTRLHLGQLENKVTDIRLHLDQLENKVTDIGVHLDQLENKVTDIRLHLENVTDRNIQLLAEGHELFISKYSKVEEISDKQFAYYVKVNSMADKINELEKELTELKNKIA